ncbi:hypothetical protein HYC85_016467 [Camellia sinensis]|uniref:Uncharacterized protein n=1 Tax=Camellia sinensis TaxID=4442 RepID=A0A7J7GZS9_CAMSI|nr:hypothetical protein HYC85_016467 [Camellia sinensis]
MDGRFRINMWSETIKHVSKPNSLGRVAGLSQTRLDSTREHPYFLGLTHFGEKRNIRGLHSQTDGFMVRSLNLGSKMDVA